MESDEGQADGPSNHEADEATKQERQADELNNNSEAAGVVGALDQDLYENMPELNPAGVVEEDVREKNLVFGVNEDQVGELTEPGEELETLVELKSSAEKEEWGAPDRDETNMLLNTDERETGEEIEGKSEKEVAESVQYNEEVGELSELGYGEDLEKIGEKESEEVPDADQRELREEALEGVSEDQKKDDGLVGIRQAEMHVLTEDEVGKLASGHTEDEVLVEFNEDMVVGKEGVESELDSSKKESEVYLRKVESSSTEGDATVVSQETEGLAGASQRDTVEVPGKDVAPYVDQEKALEDHEDLRDPESHASAVGQREIESLVGITQGEVGQVTRHEVALAVGQEQGLPEDLVNAQGVAAEGDATMVEEAVLLGSASTQVITTLDQMEAQKTRGTEARDTSKDAVLSTDERESKKETSREEIDQRHVEEKLVGESDDVAGASRDMAEEIMASVVDLALALAEGKVVESVGIGEVVTGNMDMMLTEVHGEAKEVTPESEVTQTASQEAASEAARLPGRVVEAEEDISRRGLEKIPVQDEESKEEIKLRLIQEKVRELIGPEEEVSEDQGILDHREGKQLGSAGMFAEGQQDAGRGKMPSSQKSLVWSEELAGSSIVGSQEQHRRAKGKRIKGLAGLRQGPIVMVPCGGTRSAGGISRVMKHVAPGLIVTSLTIEAERKKLMKQGHKQLSGERLRWRETKSAEPGLYETRVKVGKEMFFMGYRLGREGMSCFSEADKRAEVFHPGPELETAMFQQAGETSEIMRKKSDQGQTESLKQETKESKPLGSQVAGLEEQRLEELQLAWLGRPLSRGYAPSQPTSGWTAGLGPGHGLTLRSLRAEIKERIDMMVVGQGVSKSAGQSPEPLSLGMGKRVFGLAGKSENVHWLQEVLGPSRRASPLSVAGHSRGSHEGSPDLMAECQSPGLLSGKKGLKDWRDGVMGIAIKKYNAMRRAMWGEGPAGLHVKGVNVAGHLNCIQGSSFHAGSILEQVERKVRRLAQHVAVENMPELEVDGQVITDRFKQNMQLRSRRSP